MLRVSELTRPRHVSLALYGNCNPQPDALVRNHSYLVFLLPLATLLPYGKRAYWYLVAHYPKS